MSSQSRQNWPPRSNSNSGDNVGGGKYDSQSGLEKTCLFIIRWGIYLLMFVPLVVDLRFFFPFVAPKTALFRIIVEIIFAAYLFLIISHSKYRPKINALTVAITLFLAVFILASFTGINLERSFWSTYERMTGIFTMLHLYALFIILSSVFKKRDDWEKFLGASVIAGVFLAIYVLKGSEVSTRGGGTIGNTSFMGAYLLFDVFFAIILFLSNFLKRSGWPLFWQIFSGISLLIMLPVFFQSTAKGAIAAFIAGVFLLFLLYSFCSRKKILRRLAWEIILIFIIAGISAAILQPQFIKNILNDNIGQMSARFVIWETALNGFQERPVFGWGPENFNVVFSKYFNPCLLTPECGLEIWFDRAHNIIFDTLVTTGIAGLVVYLSIFGVAIYGLLAAALEVTERKNLFLPIGFVALLTAYFFQNLLVFDMINTYMVFFLSLAFISFLISESDDIHKEVGTKPINPVLGSVVIAVTIPLLWWGNIQPMVANHYLIKALRTQYLEEITPFFQKSVSTLMNKYEMRENFAQKISKASSQTFSDDIKPAFQGVVELTEAEMEKSIEGNPLDFRAHLFLGELYINSYRFSNDQKKLNEAEEVLRKAIRLSPTNQNGYWQLAEVKTAQGKIEEAIPLLEKAVGLEPRLSYGHWYLALAYQVAGNYQLAKTEITKAQIRGFNLDASSERINRAIVIYRALGEKDRVEELMKLLPQ